MLKIGDRVVYPMHGAGEITGVEENEVGGIKNSYFIFRLPMGDMKVMLPVDKVDEVGLREIIDAEQVEDVVKVLQAETEQLQGSWNKRYHTNLERLKTGDILEAASVARNLSRQNSKRKISSGERRLLELSRQILISELVYARGKSPEETTAWVDELIDIPTQEAS
ncbi:MAG: CarD family transcriptional regulator [Selenomonadaceae bacterium]|nr:CarD family transcriptional regulator [Selenomonadaceae bacterium]